jgi:hypothetical protein
VHGGGRRLSGPVLKSPGLQGGRASDAGLPPVSPKPTFRPAGSASPGFGRCAGSAHIYLLDCILSLGAGSFMVGLLLQCHMAGLPPVSPKPVFRPAGSASPGFGRCAGSAHIYLLHCIFGCWQLYGRTAVATSRTLFNIDAESGCMSTNQRTELPHIHDRVIFLSAMHAGLLHP